MRSNVLRTHEVISLSLCNNLPNSPHPLLLLSVCRREHARAVLIWEGDFPNSSADFLFSWLVTLCWKDCSGDWGREGLCIHGGRVSSGEAPLSEGQAALEWVEGISWLPFFSSSLRQCFLSAFDGLSTLEALGIRLWTKGSKISMLVALTF